jgi:hypothetical protein
MAEVFLCESGQLTVATRRELKRAGIVVAEVADPSKCQFIRAGEVISGDDLLWAAMEALRHREYGDTGKGDWQRTRFADNIASVIMAEHDRRSQPPEGEG